MHAADQHAPDGAAHIRVEKIVTRRGGVFLPAPLRKGVGRCGHQLHAVLLVVDAAGAAGDGGQCRRRGDGAAEPLRGWRNFSSGRGARL